jgi:hypothetical protein
LFAATNPVIETSARLWFGPWNGAYPGAAAHFEKVGDLSDFFRFV